MKELTRSPSDITLVTASTSNSAQESHSNNIFILVQTVGFKAAFNEIKEQYLFSPVVFWWSIWWILIFPLQEMVLLYATVLFFNLSHVDTYNGAVMAVGRLAAAFAAFIPSFVDIVCSLIKLNVLS